jgi:hypothetical protein
MLWPFCIFCGHFGIFFPFWYAVPRKIWQPWRVRFGGHESERNKNGHRKKEKKTFFSLFLSLLEKIPKN